MDHAVTVGNVVWVVGGIAATLGVCGLLLWFLSAIASGFNR